jgi:hypothetical protein
MGQIQTKNKELIIMTTIVDITAVNNEGFSTLSPQSQRRV